MASPLLVPVALADVVDTLSTLGPCKAWDVVLDTGRDPAEVGATLLELRARGMVCEWEGLWVTTALGERSWELVKAAEGVGRASG